MQRNKQNPIIIIKIYRYLGEHKKYNRKNNENFNEIKHRKR